MIVSEQSGEIFVEYEGPTQNKSCLVPSNHQLTCSFSLCLIQRIVSCLFFRRFSCFAAAAAAAATCLFCLLKWARHRQLLPFSRRHISFLFFPFRFVVHALATPGVRPSIDDKLPIGRLISTLSLSSMSTRLFLLFLGFGLRHWATAMASLKSPLRGSCSNRRYR